MCVCPVAEFLLPPWLQCSHRVVTYSYDKYLKGLCL
jgi:hypothetical protein